MRLLQPFRSLLAVLCLAPAAWAAVPVVDNPLLEGTEPKVRPVFPTAKVLLFPVSASDTAGQLTITATSSNPKILVRVKTGNPLMKFVISHAAGATGDAAYTETAVFQLFRDLAPETVGYIGGYAQSGFYDTGNGNKIFRLADFGAVEGQANHSFIFQGGSNTGTGSGDLGFNFDNEFSTSAMFTGSGQIAMANAGYSTFKRGTNGSQYFITDGNVRFLDYKHTIFGQLTHGFKVLREMRTTPLASATGDAAPKVPIQVTSSSLIPQYIANGRTYTDAVLVFSATAPGTAVITITATNAAGEQGTQTFTVTAQDDPRSMNTRPFLTPLQDAVIDASGQANLGFRVVDLEHDYVSYTQALASNGSGSSAKGISGLLGSGTNFFGFPTSTLAFRNQGIVGAIGNPSFLTQGTTFSIGRYTGPVYPTASITQFEPLYRGGIDGAERSVDNESGSTVGVGESNLALEQLDFTGVPAVAPAAPWIVARYRDVDPKGVAADVTAKINWGDGSTPTTGTVGTDTEKPSATGYQIAGSHTYARAGTYQVVTTITSVKGLRRLIRSTAVISANALKATGVNVALPGPTILNSVLATFIDTPAAPVSSYSATVDWGDGVVAPGTVRAAGPGRFTVVGRHAYQNAERFPVTVRVHRAGAAVEQDAIAWSLLTLTKAFGTQHLPPFNCAHLVAGVTGVPVSLHVSNSAIKATKTTLGTSPAQQTYFDYSLQIVNTGTLASKAGKLRFYLSLDKTVNLTASGSNPADVPLKIRGLNTNEFFLPAMQPGQSIQYYFTKGPYADYRLIPPPNETGTGYNFLVELAYTDPILDHLPVDKVAVDGKITGILVEPAFLSTRESETTAPFMISLDKAPTANVTVPVAVDSSGATEGTLDKASVIFTPANWNVKQTVTVKGRKDTPATTTGTTNGRDGSKTYNILIGYSTSADPFYDGQQGPSILVSNGDRDGNLVLASSTVSYTTTESAGANHMRNISFSITRKPTAPVSIVITSSNTAEGEISVPGGTSDPADPNKKILTIPVPATTDTVPFTKTFTILAKDDGVRDGDKTYTVNFQVMSNDKEFDGLTLPALTIKNTDDGAVTTP